MPRQNVTTNFFIAKRKTIVEIISALFILLFAYTAINKFIALKQLSFVLKQYPLIGSFSELVAWGLPITESVIALLLFLPRTKLIGLYSSLIMMATFTIYLAYMLKFTPKLPCTCGGMLQKLSWPQHFVFNIFFLLLSIIGIWLSKKKIAQKSEIQSTQVVFT